MKSLMRMQSPNYSKKKRLSDKFLIIHYTGATEPEGSVAWFLEKKAKVSAHFIIARDGRAWQFNETDSWLWHAGRSEWNEFSNLNGHSIGIELCCVQGLAFTDEQYKICAELLYYLRMHLSLPVHYVLGHDQVSPGRKVDPGPLFNWTLFYQYWIDECLCNDKPVPSFDQFGTLPPQKVGKAVVPKIARRPEIAPPRGDVPPDHSWFTHLLEKLHLA